ncbi:MAG: SBBP repeat-containing protein [Chloroflexi bacterium]|nr:SBBP repeat-containing protein [Chloroflexota bacterium]
MKARLFTDLTLLLIFGLMASLLPAGALPPQAIAGPVDSDHSLYRGNVAETLQSAPAMFIENAGQMDPKARFEVVGANSALFLTEEALWYRVLENSKGQPSLDRDQRLGLETSIAEKQDRKAVNLKESFVGANPHPHLEPFNRLETKVSYFRGNDPAKWRSDVPVWGGVRYVDLYPNIDLEITGDEGGLSQRMVAKPGANLSAVAMRVDGADSLNLQGDHLDIKTVVGDSSLPLLQAPTAEGALNLTSSAGPTIKGNVVAQPFAGSSPTLTSQILAPGSGLVYSTFLGGSGRDSAYSVAIDSLGAAYVTGETDSVDFATGIPPAPGYDPSYNGGNSDIFVVKLNPAGTGLTYATFLGGAYDEYLSAIAVDSLGAAYITGYSDSPDFPITSQVLSKPVTLGGRGAIVVKLSPSGRNLVYSTFLGATSQTAAFALAVNSSGQAYVAGMVAGSDFPTTPGAYAPTSSGGDGFLVKLNAAGNGLIYSTFIPGSQSERPRGLAVDPSGVAYLVGDTNSLDFPTTPGAFSRTYSGGDYDGFLTKLRPAGSGSADLLYSSYLGGAGTERPTAVGLGPAGAVYVTGYTESPTFPTTPGSYDRTSNGRDAFVSKLNPAGSGTGDLVYSTFLGGSDADGAYAIAVDSEGAAYVAGYTSSLDFPSTSNAYDRSSDGVWGDGFLSRLNPAGTRLDYSTLIGGNREDGISGLALDVTGTAYISGDSRSLDFPTVPGSFGTVHRGGGLDAFVAKLKTKELSYLPVVLDNAYGGWTTGISVRNTAATANTVRIIYYDGSGDISGSESKLLPPNGSWGLYQGGKFGGNWAGSAIISSNKPVVAVVNEIHSGGSAISYSGTSSLADDLSLPTILNDAYGGWNTGISIQNLTGLSASVTITFYDANGLIIGSPVHRTIPARGSVGLYQGGALGGKAGSAKIVSNQPLAAIVNEIGPGGSAISYNGAP